MRQMQRSHAQVMQRQAGRLAMQMGYLRSAQAAARRQEAKGGPSATSPEATAGLKKPNSRATWARQVCTAAPTC